MSAPSNNWKLGLFLVVAVVLAAVTLLVLGANSLQKETLSYYTYFDESVQGLETGSPVKFRGVTIGNVSDVHIASDKRHVEIVSALETKEVTKLGLAAPMGQGMPLSIPSDLRMQLASAGVTGVKFLSIDFFAEKDNPPPELPFDVPSNYIPAAVSVLKNLEDSIVAAVGRVPEVADEILQVTRQTRMLLDDARERAVVGKVESVLKRVDTTLAGVQGSVNDFQAGEISKEMLVAIQNLNNTLTAFNGLVARASAEDGIYTSAQRASDAVGDAARNASGIGSELGTTLRAVQDAADSIRTLTDALERDSDMLLKGRTLRSP